MLNEFIAGLYTSAYHEIVGLVSNYRSATLIPAPACYFPKCQLLILQSDAEGDNHHRVYRDNELASKHCWCNV